MMLQAGPPPKLVIAAHLSLANNRAAAGQVLARSRARPRRARDRRHQPRHAHLSPSRAAACASSPRATSSSALHSRRCNASCNAEHDRPILTQRAASAVERLSGASTSGSRSSWPPARPWSAKGTVPAGTAARVREHAAGKLDPGAHPRDRGAHAPRRHRLSHARRGAGRRRRALAAPRHDLVGRARHVAGAPARRRRRRDPGRARSAAGGAEAARRRASPHAR